MNKKRMIAQVFRLQPELKKKDMSIKPKEEDPNTGEGFSELFHDRLRAHGIDPNTIS